MFCRSTLKIFNRKLCLSLFCRWKIMIWVNKAPWQLHRCPAVHIPLGKKSACRQWLCISRYNVKLQHQNLAIGKFFRNPYPWPRLLKDVRHIHNEMMDLPGSQVRIQLTRIFGELDDKARPSLNLASGYHMACTSVKHHIDLFLSSHIRGVRMHRYSLKDDEFNTKLYEKRRITIVILDCFKL